MEKPKESQSGHYFKITDDKTQKIKFLSPLINGYIIRDKTNGQNKPIREKSITPEMKLLESKENRIKEFFTGIVYDYKDKTVKIFEITQKTIQNELFNLSEGDWGNPIKSYSVNVRKTGQKMDTEYFITPSPIRDEEGNNIKIEGIDLEQLFINQDPLEGYTQTEEEPVF